MCDIILSKHTELLCGELLEQREKEKYINGGCYLDTQSLESGSQ